MVRRNGEGYMDRTAAEAIERVDRERRRNDKRRNQRDRTDDSRGRKVKDGAGRKVEKKRAAEREIRR